MQVKHLALEKKLEMTHALLHAAHSQWLPAWTNPYTDAAWTYALPAVMLFRKVRSACRLHGTTAYVCIIGCACIIVCACKGHTRMLGACASSEILQMSMAAVLASMHAVGAAEVTR